MEDTFQQDRVKSGRLALSENGCGLKPRETKATCHGRLGFALVSVQIANAPPVKQLESFH